jgi:acyl-homoserine-lactone acylase
MMRAVLLAPLLIVATAASAESVSVTTTKYGIPHIKANTLDGAGYGNGWTFARDNACEFLEEVVTTRAERSLFFGETEKIYDIFTLTGGQYSNLISDTYHRWLFGADAARKQVAGMNKDVRALTNGYVRGFNAWVRANPDKLAKTCRGKPWVRPVTISDVGIRALKFTTRSSTSYFAEGLGGQMPGADADAPVKTSALVGPRSGTELGSNMAAFGKARTGNGTSLHFSNPHFPWLGIERLWMAHTTVPGKLDVFGGVLLGMPIQAAGFNASQGWSLTWADNQRAVYHELTLAPGDPTAYIVDGKIVKMKQSVLNVPVKGADGKTEIRRRTVWESRYGPVVQAPIMPWTKTRAYAIDDANRENNRFLNMLMGISTATTVSGVKAVMSTTLGNPISNLTSADSNGDVLYSGISVTPDVPDALLKACVTSPYAQIMQTKFNMAILDGSRSACATPKSGSAMKIIPASRLPSAIRDDYVVHSNNAHVIVNADPNSFMTGYQRVVGVEDFAIGERTRRALQLAEQRHAGTDGLPGKAMNAETLEAIFWQSKGVLADAILPDILTDCQANPVVALPSGEQVDLTKACAVLTAWDRTDRLTSIGSHIFGRLLRKMPKLDSTGGITLPADLWKVPFDPKDPINTPRGLKVDARVRVALGRTVKELLDAKIPLDAPLGAVQFVERNGERLPLSGSAAGYNLMYASIKPGVGLTDPIPFANSYMHIVTFGKDGPVARGLLTYSQSTDTASPHSSDQTKVVSEQRLIKIPFTQAQIDSESDAQKETLNSKQR